MKTLTSILRLVCPRTFRIYSMTFSNPFEFFIDFAFGFLKSDCGNNRTTIFAVFGVLSIRIASRVCVCVREFNINRIQCFLFNKH